MEKMINKEIIFETFSDSFPDLEKNVVNMFMWGSRVKNKKNIINT